MKCFLNEDERGDGEAGIVNLHDCISVMVIIFSGLIEHVADNIIDVVELDPGVITAGKQYFGLQETDKVHFIENDGRVFLNHSKDLYDLIL